MFDFIERLRAKPEHVRRRIAFGTAAGLTGVVTIGWMAALVAGNAFILTPNQDAPTLADSLKPLSENANETQSNIFGLLGAAGAATDTKAPASLTIIETDTSSTLDVAQTPTSDNRTVIPF